MRKAKYIKLLLVVLHLAVLCFSSCNRDKDIRDYYFPVKSLKDGKVYVYEPLESLDTNLVYWYLLSKEDREGFFLNTTIYDLDFSPQNLNTEKITNAGALAEQVLMYATDSTGLSSKSKAEILAGNVFPFTIPDSKEQPAYVYRINIDSPSQDSSEYRITYNRQYSRDTSIMILGENLPAVVFKIVGETDVRNAQGQSFAPKFDGFEIYAKGVGLVESYRNYDGFIFHQRLLEQISMADLQERAKIAKATAVDSAVFGND